MMLAATLQVLLVTTTLRYEQALPTLPYVRTQRECHVHHCDDVGERMHSLTQKKKCDKRKGHMAPMGEQQATMLETPRVHLKSPSDFYEHYIAASEPVILADAATEATRGVEWTDEFLLEQCRLHNGRPWKATVEVNKVIVSNTRYPLMRDWTNFKRFPLKFFKSNYANCQLSGSRSCFS